VLNDPYHGVRKMAGEEGRGKGRSSPTGYGIIVRLPGSCPSQEIQILLTVRSSFPGAGEEQALITPCSRSARLGELFGLE